MIFTFLTTQKVLAVSKEYVSVKDSISVTIDNIKIKSLHFVDNRNTPANNFGLIADIANTKSEDFTLIAKISYYDEQRVLLYSNVNRYEMKSGRDNILYGMLDCRQNSKYDVDEIAFYSVDFDIEKKTFQEEKTYSTPAVCQNDNYAIENYRLDIEVNENDIYKVKEKFDVIYKDNSYQMKRTVPIDTFLYNRDKSTYRYYTKILEYEKEDNLSVYFNTAGKVFTFEDDADKKTHHLKYIYTVNKKGKEDFVDIFISPTRWGSCLRKIEFTITLPKDFDVSKLQFVDSEGKDQSKKITINKHNRNLTGRIDSLLKDEDIHITLFLGENYFTKTQDANIIIAFAIPTGFVILSFLLWFFFGRDKKENIKATANLPDADILELCLLQNESLANEHISLLVIQLAKEGYLKIKKIANTNNFEIVKLAEYNGESPLEKKLMTNLFKDELTRINENILATNYNKGKGTKKLKDLRSITIDTTNMTGSLEEAAKELSAAATEEYNDQLFEKAANVLSKIVSIFTIIILLSTFAIPSLKYGTWEDAAIIICLIFIVIVSIKEGILKNHNLKIRIISLILVFASLLLSRTTTLWETCLYEKIYIYSFLWGILMILVNCLLKKVMPKKTSYGTKLKEELTGLKLYFTKSKKNTIEKKLTNPTYFEEFLPYMYVLHFDRDFYRAIEEFDITLPNWLEAMQKEDLRTLPHYLGLIFKELPNLDKKK